MSTDQAIDYLKGLMSETDRKSEIKKYQNFIGILLNFKKRDLTQKQLQLWEKELDTLIEKELNTIKIREIPFNREKYLKEKLTKFKIYLMYEFYLISEKHYTELGILIGGIFGITLGMIPGVIRVLMNDMEFGKIINVKHNDMIYEMIIGAALGLIIGILIGRINDTIALKQDRVLKIKLK